MSKNRITVLLVEDHNVVREGIRSLLEMEADFEIIGVAEDGRRAVALGGILRPAVVVMDIAMPMLNGLEATRQILKAVPSTKILILSAHSNDEYAKNARESGAVGFLPKQASAHLLCEAIREVNKGRNFFGSVIAKRLPKGPRKSSNRGGQTKPRKASLTSREMEVVQLVAEGKANKEIAAELSISISTAQKHRNKAMKKLNIHHTAGLTHYAIRAGIIESSVQVTIV
jgi:DNA-binding NarL/FixJ family response regulator